jgi:predicted metal-dependent hydrolase
MTELTVRRLLIDLTTPFAVRWNGNDAFRSAFFNALSMSFPQGEQYFIDSVRAGLKVLPATEQARLGREVQGFIGQEATHRRIHGLFNGHLQTMGFTNGIERRAVQRIADNAHRDVRVHVAATAATEHMTAIFADWMLQHPEALAGSEDRLKTLWLWHSAEESEHRSTAFDIYLALGGSQDWRVRVFRYVTFIFLKDVALQTISNLWQDAMQALSPTDSAFLWMETRNQPMHVAGLNIFTPPPGAGQTCGQTAGRLGQTPDCHGPLQPAPGAAHGPVVLGEGHRVRAGLPPAPPGPAPARAHPRAAGHWCRACTATCWTATARCGKPM